MSKCADPEPAGHYAPSCRHTERCSREFRMYTVPTVRVTTTLTTILSISLLRISQMYLRCNNIHVNRFIQYIMFTVCGIQKGFWCRYCQNVGSFIGISWLATESRLASNCWQNKVEINEPEESGRKTNNTALSRGSPEMG